MEIRFKNPDVKRPVYDFVVKQEWEEHVRYECPAKLSDIERKNIEKIVRETFWALDCRDVARVDLRMGEDGQIYVLEVNPLPGLTPNYSDLVLISKAAGMDYDQLMAEIMLGGLRRLRDKRRAEAEDAAAASRKSNGNGNGRARGTRAARVAEDAATKIEKAAEKAEKAAEKAEKAARKMARLARSKRNARAKPDEAASAEGNGRGNGHAGEVSMTTH
jgi:D-alanine-D-alanine ligase